MSEVKKELQELEIPFSRKEEKPPENAPKAPKKRKGFHIPAPAWFAIGCAAVIGALLFGLRIRDTVLGEEVVLLDSSRPVFAGYSGGGYLAEDFAPEESALASLREEAEARKAKGRNTDSLEKLISSIHCGFETEGGYKNNDNVIYACSYDAEAAEQAGIRFASAMKSYTVSGLEEYAVLDVFSGVSADWQLSSSGLSIVLNAPQEYLDMGISYVYDYGMENTYNGESINIHAEFDQNELRSYGYIVENDEIVCNLGPMPVQITDADSLDSDDRALLRDEIQAMLEGELAACGNRAALSSLTGSYSVEITGISKAYIEESSMNFFRDNYLFRITFDLETNSDSLMSSYSSYTASYTGSIYRMGDDSLRFLTNTVHACEFTGFFGNYSLKENSD